MHRRGISTMGNASAQWIYSNGLGYYAPGTRKTLDMKNGESLNLVPRSVNS